VSEYQGLVEALKRLAERIEDKVRYHERAAQLEGVFADTFKILPTEIRVTETYACAEHEILFAKLEDNEELVKVAERIVSLIVTGKIAYVTSIKLVVEEYEWPKGKEPLEWNGPFGCDYDCNEIEVMWKVADDYRAIITIRYYLAPSDC